MTPYFADSYYYLGLLNPRDEAHFRVADFTRAIERPVVTTAWVLTEVGDALAAPQQRLAFVDLIDDLRADSEVDVVPPTAEFLDRGYALFRNRPDKHWSLTDCISFVVMRERGLTDALTGDHHFEQGGFRALLK